MKEDALSPDVSPEGAAFLKAAFALEPIAIPARITTKHKILRVPTSTVYVGRYDEHVFRFGTSHRLIPRATRILETILTTLESIGATIQHAKYDGHLGCLDVVVDPARVTFRLRETFTQQTVTRSWGGPSLQQQHSGRFELSVHQYQGGRLPRRTFKDSDSDKVEDHLTEFIRNLPRAMVYECIDAVQRQREAVLQKRRWEEAERRIRIVDIEAALTKDLVARADLLVVVDRMRTFLADPRTADAARARGEPWASWLSWADTRARALEQRALAGERPKDAAWFLEARAELGDERSAVGDDRDGAYYDD